MKAQFNHRAHWVTRFQRAHQLLLKCLNEMDMLSPELQVELRKYMATVQSRKTRKQLVKATKRNAA